MSIELTSYEIEEIGTIHRVYLNGFFISSTVLGIESALHSIWVLNGSVDNHYYELIDNRIYKRTKDER
jgi:hypothetical protein